MYIDISSPHATASINGNQSNPELEGTAMFYKSKYKGIFVKIEVWGLPVSSSSADAPAFFGLHIHENGDCYLPFDKVGNHYNPKMLPHPNHAGDLPPLLSNNGYAFMTVYDEFLELEDIIGKAIIVHSHSDDFKTQTSGDAGEKIGCGVIKWG